MGTWALFSTENTLKMEHSLIISCQCHMPTCTCTSFFSQCHHNIMGLCKRGYATTIKGKDSNSGFTTNPTSYQKCCINTISSLLISQLSTLFPAQESSKCPIQPRLPALRRFLISCTHCCRINCEFCLPINCIPCSRHGAESYAAAARVR